jgi:hypothetical protein
MQTAKMYEYIALRESISFYSTLWWLQQLHFVTEKSPLKFCSSFYLCAFLFFWKRVSFFLLFFFKGTKRLAGFLFTIGQ